MNNEAAAKVAKEITRIYNAQCERGEWMSLTRLAEHHDFTQAEISHGVRYLARNEAGFNSVPESNQKMLTDMDEMCAAIYGGQRHHLIIWQ